jgi:putative Holliday junction resolvase
MHQGRILAVDYGERRIGLAISDPMRIIASALETLVIRKEEEAVRRISEIVRDQEVQRIVIGMPLEKSGLAGEKASKVKAFTERLAATVAVPIVFWDERLSTVSAKQILLQAETKKKRRTKERLDTLAAVVILRHFLDANEGRN